MSKPAAVHRLNGTYRKDRHGGQVEAPMIGGMPDAPEAMNERARYWWSIKVIDLKDMGLLYRCDMEMLEKYCQLLAEMDAARTIMNELTNSRADETLRDKLIRRHNEALRYALLMVREFGFTPLARTKLKAGDTKPELDEFDAL